MTRPSMQELDADVVIIGGGLAGLTTAVGLAAQGLKPVLLERDGLLGGRARSWIDAATGDPVTVGPHIFLSAYPNMRQLLRWLGTEGQVVWRSGALIDIVQGQRVIPFRRSALPPPLQYLPGMFRERDYFPVRDTLSNFKSTFYSVGLREEDFMILDNEAAPDVLRRLGVTENSIRTTWAFTCMSIMNVPIEECSAGALLRFYKLMVNRNRLDVGFADGGLGDLFAPQARAFIERAGGAVFTETAVERITGENHTATGVRLADGRTLTARHVVAALPPSQLEGLLPTAWRGSHRPFTELDRFKPSPYISTYLWFDRKLTTRQLWARAYDAQDLNTDFYDYSNIYTGRASDHSLITANCIYSARAEHLSDEEIIAATRKELAEFLPESARARLVHSLVVRIPMAIHCPLPGTEQRRPPVTTPIHNLFIAGDWIQTGVPASMESACCAGWQAAEAVLAAAGRPHRLALSQSRAEGLAYWVERMAPWLRRTAVFPSPERFVQRRP